MPEFSESLWSAGSLLSWAALALALYGLVSALAHTSRLLRRLHGRHGTGLSILVLIHNQEEQIEAVVRELALLHGRVAADVTRHEVLLVDYDSNDDTPLILERMVADLPQFRLVRLPRTQATNVCDSALFLCQSPAILLLDLRYRVDARRMIRTLVSCW